MAYRILLRRDSSENWISANPVLLEGEPGYETNTGKMKIGDGSNNWENLGYYGGTGPIGPTGPSGTVYAPNYQTENYILTESDSEKIIDFNSELNLTLTIPLNSTAALPTGTTIRVIRSGSGEVTIDPSPGVSLNYPSNYLNRIREVYSVVSLVQVSSNVWYLYGDLLINQI
jgi:hypothetical protein